MKSIIKTVAIVSLLFFISGSVYAGKKDPVGVLFQTQGKVEYTKNGKKWKKVRRSKFLFSGYQIKTGPDSSAKVTIKESGITMDIGANSVIDVAGNELAAKSGSLSASESSGKLMSGLMKKFSKAQSYTTVRRSHKKKTVKISAARKVALTDKYPYLVWNNIGSEYNYQLTIGDQTYRAPATSDKVIRVKVDSFTGEQPYKILALKGENPVTELKPYKSKGKTYMHQVLWLEGQQKSDVSSKITEIQDTFGEDSFMLGSFFEKQEMWVAAMDQYRLYLEENPDELEMTPYLFRVYKKLKLNGIYKKELEAWKVATME